MLNLKSQPGDAWASYYRTGMITWAKPETIDQVFINRLAHSEAIQKLLAMSALAGTAQEHRILEAGCGLGLYAMALTLRGYSVTAFDYNEEAIRIAERVRDRANLRASPLQFSIGNLLNIQQSSNSFDLVFNQAVMEYFCDSDEFNEALREMIRILKPNRRLVLIVQNTKHPLLPFKAKLGHRGFTNQPPVHPISALDLSAYFRQHGLQHIKVDGIDPWKSILHGIPFATSTRLLHDLTYLSYRAMRVIPLPISLRSQLALQFIVSGEKA